MIDFKSKILAIIYDNNMLEMVKYSLKDQDDFTLLEQSTDGILTQISKTKPDILLIELELTKNRSHVIIDNIAEQFPDLAILVIIKETEANLMDGVVLTGAKAFIIYPFSQEKFLTALQRVAEIVHKKPSGNGASQNGSASANKLKNTIIVFSPKGGTGCSTVAVNLSIALQQQTKEPVLLLDGKFLFGDIALYLNLRSTNSISDLISHAGMLDQKLVGQVVTDHSSGIKVLPCPSSAKDAQGIRPEDLYKVLTEIQSIYPLVVIDGGNYLDENTVTLMDASNKIIVTMNPDLSSIRDVRQFIDVCQMLSYPPEKITLVLINSGFRTDLHKDEIEKTLKQKIACQIPGDYQFIQSSLNEGVPAIVKKPRHPINKAITKFAEELRNELITKKTSG